MQRFSVSAPSASLGSDGSRFCPGSLLCVQEQSEQSRAGRTNLLVKHIYRSIQSGPKTPEMLRLHEVSITQFQHIVERRGLFPQLCLRSQNLSYLLAPW